MNRSGPAISIIVVFTLLLIGTPASADPACSQPDRVAVYFDNGEINAPHPGANSQFVANVVLLNQSEPWFETMEFTLSISNPTNVFKLSESLPYGTINIGDTSNLVDGLHYIAGIAHPVYPTGDHSVFVSITFLPLTSDQMDFFIAPVVPPSLAGAMSYQGEYQTLIPMYPVSGSTELPIARLVVEGPDLDYCSNAVVGQNVEVKAFINYLSDYQNFAATGEDATDGFDPGLDIPEPSPPPSNFVALSFNHPEWPLGPRFNEDIKAIFDPLLEEKVWPVMVETDQTGNVSLVFTPNFTQSDYYGLRIKDLQTGQTFNLFPSLAYSFQSPGPGVYHFELTIGQPAPPDLDPTSRDIPAGWTMIGLPLYPPLGANSVGDVILDQLPGYGYLYEYSNTGNYSNLTDNVPAALGNGYWIGSDSDFTWTMTGERALTGTQMFVNPGWNLIGFPLWFPGPAESIRVIHQNSTYDWQTAVSMGLVANTIYGYDSVSDQYVNTLDLQPWHGYWISVLTNGVELAFDWPSFQTMPKRFSEGISDNSKINPNWQTEIQLVDSAGKSRSVIFGANEKATTEFDPVFDLPQPPASPSGGPTLAFHRPDWDLPSGPHFTADIISTDDEILEWTVLANSSNQGSSVLSWDSSDWPEGLDFQVYLPAENRVVVMSMRNQNELDIDLGAISKQLVIRTPDLMSGVGASSQYTSGLKAVPNPFNPSTVIHFEMDEPGMAEIRIYTIRGELVDRLVRDHYLAGRYEADWNGMDRNGQSVPSGSYFAKLYVDGQPKGSVTKLSLVR